MTEIQTGLEPKDAGAAPVPAGDLLAYHARKDASKPAITFGDVTVSYAELDSRANRRARQLASLGVGENDTVTVAMPKSIDIYEVLFAVWKLGAKPNLVSTKLPEVELRAIVELAKPKLIVGPAEFQIDGFNFLLACESVEGFSDAALPSKVAQNWKVMTSGGSTGRPKLIVDQRPAAFYPDTPILGQTLGDTILNPGPLYHNAPFSFSISCLSTGGHLIEMERFDALCALELIDRHKVGWVNFVPTMMQRIWRLPEEQRLAFDMSSLRVIFHMGAACPPWLKQAWIEWLGAERILELYGGTEGQGLTMISGDEWLQHKGSVGKVLPGYHMRVVNEDGEDCKPGEIGEVYFLPDSGKGSTYEYVGATPRSRGDWESLGDLGYVDEDNYLYLADRRTDMIVSGGANIYPAEVEAALDAHEAVLSSIVIGLPDEDLGQKVHAIVQLAPSRADVTEDGLRDFLATRLVRYKVPRSFEFTDEFLRDDAGKARRSKMRSDRISS